MNSWQVLGGFLAGSGWVLDGFLAGSTQKGVLCDCAHLLEALERHALLGHALLGHAFVQVKVWAFFIFELERVKVSLQWKETGSRLTGTFLAPPSGSWQRW